MFGGDILAVLGVGGKRGVGAKSNEGALSVVSFHVLFLLTIDENVCPPEVILPIMNFKLYYYLQLHYLHIAIICNLYGHWTTHTHMAIM